MPKSKARARPFTTAARKASRKPKAKRTAREHQYIDATHLKQSDRTSGTSNSLNFRGSSWANALKRSNKFQASLKRKK